MGGYKDDSWFTADLAAPGWCFLKLVTRIAAVDVGDHVLIVGISPIQLRITVFM